MILLHQPARYVFYHIEILAVIKVQHRTTIEKLLRSIIEEHFGGTPSYEQPRLLNAQLRAGRT